MSEQKLLLVLFSVIILFSVIALVAFTLTTSSFFNAKPLTLVPSGESTTTGSVSDNSNSTTTQESFPSDRAERFSISGGKTTPLFAKEIIIDPAASPTLSPVKEGERQTYSIWARDPEGITKVSARIRTDKKEEFISFKLVEGPDIEGRWQGFWITDGILTMPYYTTIFEAVNKEGKTAKLDFVWYVQK